MICSGKVMFEYGLATHYICLFWLESRKKKIISLHAKHKGCLRFEEMLGLVPKLFSRQLEAFICL